MMYRADRMAEQANVGWILLFDCSEAGLVRNDFVLHRVQSASNRLSPLPLSLSLLHAVKIDERRFGHGQFRGQLVARSLSVRATLCAGAQLSLVLERVAQRHLCNVAGACSSKCEIFFGSFDRRVYRTLQSAGLHGRRRAEQQVSMGADQSEVDRRNIESDR